MHSISMRRLRSNGRGTSILRDINEIVVLNIIRERQPISRVAIAELAGLEPGSVTRILQRFLENRMVSEAGTGPSSAAGGRKPRYVTLNAARQSAIGVEIGARETLLALSDLNGQIQDFRRVQNTRDPESTLSLIVSDIRSLLQRAKAYEEFGGIGVGLIGLIDQEAGTILEGENLGWPEPVEVGRYLRSRIKDVPFYFENDARLSALGEKWFGPSRLHGVRHLVVVSVDDGVGAGIIIDGQLYRGYRNGAGEFGHVCIEPSGPKCSCGSHGCLEVMASDSATIQRYIRRVNSGDTGRIDMQLIVDLANRGDSYAQATLRETATYLGFGLAPIIYGLSPELIIVTGTIVEAWPLVHQVIWDAASQRVSQPFMNNTKLQPSTMQVKPSLMGAVSLVLARSFAAPELFSAY